MEITKGKLKKIIKEEMGVLLETGDLSAITEAEKEVFLIILEKLNPKELESFGLKKNSWQLPINMLT